MSLYNFCHWCENGRVLLVALSVRKLFDFVSVYINPYGMAYDFFKLLRLILGNFNVTCSFYITTRLVYFVLLTLSLSVVICRITYWTYSTDHSVLAVLTFCTACVIPQGRGSSDWRLHRRWRHRGLSLRQLTVPPIAAWLSGWRPFVFSDIFVYSVYSHLLLLFVAVRQIQNFYIFITVTPKP